MGKTILIVEDEAIIAMDMEMTLTELGHRVFIAPDPVGAARALDEHRIDAALLDWHGAASTPLGEMLRQRGIPFALCSGTNFTELAEMFRDVPCVSKPFSTSDLV